MTAFRYISASLLSLATAISAAAADDLTKEITVEKEIVPIERDAQRLNILPAFSLPAVETKSLSWAQQGIDAPVTTLIYPLSAPTYGATITPSPYKGYIDAGYFPLLQVGVSAGYRFIDTDATRLGAWLQYDGSDYKRENIAGNKLNYHDHTVAIGAAFRHEAGSAGILDARAGYSFSGFNHPTLFSKGISQTANAFNLGAKWTGKADAIDYTASIDYGYFRFSKPWEPVDNHQKPLNQNCATFNLGGTYDLESAGLAGIDMNVGIARTGNCFTLEPNLTTLKADSYNHGYFTLTPYYKFSRENYSVKLGVQLYHLWGDNSGFRIAPEVMADWHPVDKFTIYGRLSGGNPSLNSIASLFSRNHYINPSLTYSDTWQSWMVDAGFLIGPFTGASFEVWGSIGKSNNVAMSILTDMDDLSGSLSGVDLKDRHFGIAFNYAYRDMARLRVAYEGASGDWDSGYSLWVDRAKSVFTASVAVTPIDRLDVNLGYDLRSGRSTYLLTYNPNSTFLNVEALHNKVGLGNLSNLHLGADYRITPALTAGIQIENLLNQKWQAVYGIPSKGVTGLIGIGFKF